MKRLLLSLSIIIFQLSFSSAQQSIQSVPVILVAGQSNADGRVPLSDLPDELRTFKYCQWSYGSGDFETATGRFTPFSPRVAKPGIEQSWGFDAVVYHLLEQRWQQPFYVIKQTMGGTAIDTACNRSTHGWFWSPDAGAKSLLKAFCRQIDDCLPQLPKIYDIRCLIWHQGESDQPAAARYYDNMKAVVAYVRQHLVEVTGEARYATLPVICGTFAKGSKQGSAKVAEALYKLQRDDANFHVVDASDLTLQRDQLHFDAKGAVALGRRVFQRLVNRPLDVWPVTDKALMKSLNGEWRLKVVDKIDDHSERVLKVVDKIDDHSERVPANWGLVPVPAVDDTWGHIPVPGCWEAYGFCQPKYNYPDSLTGYYRTAFTLPKAWKGQQVIIRLDGVLRGYDLWLNDRYVGTWESGYNTRLFDLTPYLTEKAFRGEPQQLAMRVYSRYKGYEFDCFDDWATMGIFRDITLFPVPKTHLADLTVTTKMNGEVTVKAEVANATRHTSVECRVESVEFATALPSADGTAVANSPLYTLHSKLCSPRLWTAETPYLYTLRVYVKEKGKTLQTFTQKIGIREVTIDGNILKLNGQPIKLRGVNAHSTDPYTVKVVSDDLTLKDMHMMKEASVNYMRLSHYPREPRFFELADSLGFYLVDEVPFGFGDKHLSSRSYQHILMDRAQSTVWRDKNHPSVIVWSVGNENPLPQTCVEVGDYVGRLDPSRPYCFPQVGSYFRKFWEKATVATGSTGTAGTAGTSGATGTTGASGAAANSSLFTLHSSLKSPFPSSAPVYAPHYPTTGQIGGFYQTLDRPVIFTEYCHTLGISFEDHDRQWDIIERTPGIAGGSVWEWADQGMPFTKKGGGYKWRTDGGGAFDQSIYTTMDGGFYMNGNFGTDGLVYADRTPLPNYYELQHNYARAFVSSVSCDTIATNMTITNRYDFLNLRDNVTFHWALTSDRDTVKRGAFSPDCTPRSSVPYTLHLSGEADSSFFILHSSGEADSSLFTLHSSLKTLHFTLTDKDGHTFLRQSFPLNKPQIAWTGHGSGEVMAQEMTIRTGRKPTMAERITQQGRLPHKYLLPVKDGVAALADTARIQVDIQSKPIIGGEEVTFTLTPDTTDLFRSELGLAYLLDPSIDRVQWLGYGPFASYPGRCQANRYGLWAKHKDDLYFDGNHSVIEAALLTDSLGNGVLVTTSPNLTEGEESCSPPLEGMGEVLNLNFEQTDRGIVLTVNAAVSGQGPKFAKTAFPGWQKGDGPVGATFCFYYIKGDVWPDVLKRLFMPAADVPAPFRPFLTQYDTYLRRYKDIRQP